MTVEERMDRLEARWGKQDDLVRELRDAVTVTAYLENQQGKLVKQHSELLAEHSEHIKEQDAWQARHRAAMEDLDQQIASLVSAIGALIAKQ